MLCKSYCYKRLEMLTMLNADLILVIVCLLGMPSALTYPSLWGKGLGLSCKEVNSAAFKV